MVNGELDGILGYVDLKENKINVIKENLVNYMTKHWKTPGEKPRNFDVLKKNNPDKIFIWGGETTTRLVKYIINEKDYQKRKLICGLIFTTINVDNRRVLVFKKLKDLDEDFFNTLDSGLLNKMGLKKNVSVVVGKAIGRFIGKIFSVFR